MAQWKGIVGKGFTPDDFDTYVASVVLTAWRPHFVVLHNTASPKLSQWHSVAGLQRMQNLQNYYQNTMQWSAGPHLFVADDLIWVFTPLNVSGIHSPSWNSVAWGVEMVGDYETEPFGDAVRGNAIRTLATLHVTLGLDPNGLKLHKEDPRTTHNCPGKNVVKSDIIQGVLEQMASTNLGEHVPGALPS
jgi:hypothetical protein